MYDRDWPPEGLPAFAREVEALGVDDLWVVEDLGWNGGVSAAAALAATQQLRVRQRTAISGNEPARHCSSA
jgi:5,10-methylenetetrahydromethanopterin reductase